MILKKHRLIYFKSFKVNLFQASAKAVIEEQQIQLSQLEEDFARMKVENVSEIKMLTEAFDRDKRKMKNNYETLVNELSSEIKQIYEKMSSEMISKDQKLRELYHIIQEKDRATEENRTLFMIKLDSVSHDIEKLSETNKHRIYTSICILYYH